MIFLQIFWNNKKAEWLFLSHWIFIESLEFQWSAPVIWRKVMKRLIFEGYTKQELRISFNERFSGKNLHVSFFW